LIDSKRGFILKTILSYEITVFDYIKIFFFKCAYYFGLSVEEL